ncbi:hypothetical protein EZV73_01130 [Acidaminobacter sp. JC074]|uniref:hypothetical protein n=1 Tax=Acidaminobacter sp. JC074 TaxID=2530199 RepID=UPI001F0EC143|nr:hypothetical protein [Acidaminobacter sp. JC074]MCH4886145.1 hypothetical protein [Acidaminobacter sp. JC074]
MKKILLLLMAFLLIGCEDVSCVKLDYDISQVDEPIILDEAYKHADVFDLNITVEGFKVYQVSDFNHILFVKDDLIFQMPYGYLEDIYLLDSNGDGKDELLVVSDIGSGLLIIQMAHFDPVTKEITVGHFYNDNDRISVDVLEGKLVAYSEYTFGRASEPIGEISFKEKVEIEGMVDHLEKDN